jgi:acyl-CoA dehydrogenase
VDFNLPEELQVLKDTVRRFVDRELIPLERECRPEGEDMPEQYIKPLQEKAKAIGLWLLDVPQEYGGAGLDLMSRCVIMEEVARTVAIPFRYAPIFGPDGRPVLFHCNEEQKNRFLFPVIRGEKRICFAQTEPDAGSDPAGMKTRAVRDGDYYIINGTKRFITGAKNNEKENKEE